MDPRRAWVRPGVFPYAPPRVKNLNQYFGCQRLLVHAMQGMPAAVAVTALVAVAKGQGLTQVAQQQQQTPQDRPPQGSGDEGVQTNIRTAEGGSGARREAAGTGHSVHEA